MKVNHKTKSQLRTLSFFDPSHEYNARTFAETRWVKITDKLNKLGYLNLLPSILPVCFNIVLLIISSVIYRIDQRITGVEYQLNNAKVSAFKDSLNPPTTQQQLLQQFLSVVNTLNLLAQHAFNIKLQAPTPSLNLSAYADTTENPTKAVSYSSSVKISPKKDPKIQAMDFRGQIASMLKKSSGKPLLPSHIKKCMRDASKASITGTSPNKNLATKSTEVTRA